MTKEGKLLYRIDKTGKSVPKEVNILFKNEPFMASVTDMGGDMWKCTAVVYSKKREWGIGFIVEGADYLRGAWSPGYPRNIIALWRGTEILRCLGTCDEATLVAAFYTGERTHVGLRESAYVEWTVVEIGRIAYKAVMSMPVPKTIVRASLDFHKQWGSDSELSAAHLENITDEVRAGTIKWRQEFAEAGVRHPNTKRIPPSDGLGGF